MNKKQIILYASIFLSGSIFTTLFDVIFKESVGFVQIKNNSPFELDDLHIKIGDKTFKFEDVKSGKTVWVIHKIDTDSSYDFYVKFKKGNILEIKNKGYLNTATHSFHEFYLTNDKINLEDSGVNLVYSSSDNFLKSD